MRPRRRLLQAIATQTFHRRLMFPEEITRDGIELNLKSAKIALQRHYFLIPVRHECGAWVNALTTSGGRSVGSEREKAALLEIHSRDRRAHFETDVEAALASVHEPHIYVRNGAIQHLSRSDMEKTFREYFRDTTFLEWDDLEEPIVNVSRDGTMGWMVERLKVRRIIKGEKDERQFIYAGITVYEKRDGTWLKIANASTFTM